MKKERLTTKGKKAISLAAKRRWKAYREAKHWKTRQKILGGKRKPAKVLAAALAVLLVCIGCAVPRVSIIASAGSVPEAKRMTQCTEQNRTRICWDAAGRRLLTWQDRIQAEIDSALQALIISRQSDARSLSAASEE